MTTKHLAGRLAAPPAFADLLTDYLGRRADAPLASDAPEVEPFEVGGGVRVDPKLAWTEAAEALRQLHPTHAPATAPAEWATLVGLPESQAAVPLAAGAFPQLLRDLQPLLRPESLKSLLPRSKAEPTVSAGVAAGLRTWAERADRWLAAGVLRAAGLYADAGRLHAADAASTDAAVRLNESAALLWATGACEAAAAIWERAAEQGVPMRFNAGMALLFLDRSAEAREHLSAAVARLPESSGWHHLGRLYLAVAEMRS